MIVRNPSNGAPVKRRVGMKYWAIDVGKTLEFPDIVGGELCQTYGFLEEIKRDKKPEVLRADVGFRCSFCEYQSTVKVAVMNHIKKHGQDETVYEKAQPVGDAEKRMSLFESRAMRSRAAAEQMPGGTDTPGFYGEKFEES